MTIGGVTTPYTDLHEALVAGSAKDSVVELIADVDLKDENWVPVANFNGTFDGKDYTISNLSIDATTGNTGLFAGGVGMIRNFTMEDVTVTSTGSKVGAIVGEGGSGMIVSNITVCGTIQITGKEYVSALVGHGGYAKIVNCHVVGDEASTITAEAKVGGIWGMAGEDTFSAEAINCTVKNLSIEATSTTDTKAGALFGRLQTGNIALNCSAENCVVKGTQATIGGIAGRFESNATKVTYVLNTTATNVELQDGDGQTITYKDFGDLVNQVVIVSSDAVTDFKAGDKNFAFTGGTFTPYNAAAVTAATVGLNAQVAKGYAAIDNEDGTYTIQAVYGITITPPTNGTLETSVTNGVLEGATVEVFANADEGYELDTITVMNGAVPVTLEENNTFTMPAGNVTVAATFKEVQSDPIPPIDPTDPEADKKIAEVTAKFIDTTVAANISKANYTAFQTWADSCLSGQDAVVASADAFLCFALNTDDVPAEPITADDVKIAAYDNATGVIEVQIEGIEPGETVPEGELAKVLTAIGGEELDEMSKENVTVSGQCVEAGKIQVTVTPKAANPTAFFIRADLVK